MLFLTLPLSEKTLESYVPADAEMLGSVFSQLNPSDTIWNQFPHYFITILLRAFNSLAILVFTFSPNVCSIFFLFSVCAECHAASSPSQFLMGAIITLLSPTHLHSWQESAPQAAVIIPLSSSSNLQIVALSVFVSASCSPEFGRVTCLFLCAC